MYHLQDEALVNEKMGDPLLKAYEGEIPSMAGAGRKKRHKRLTRKRNRAGKRGSHVTRKSKRKSKTRKRNRKAKPRLSKKAKRNGFSRTRSKTTKNKKRVTRRR